MSIIHEVEMAGKAGDVGFFFFLFFWVGVEVGDPILSALV